MSTLLKSFPTREDLIEIIQDSMEECFRDTAAKLLQEAYDRTRKDPLPTAWEEADNPERGLLHSMIIDLSAALHDYLQRVVDNDEDLDAFWSAADNIELVDHRPILPRQQ